MSNDFLIEIGAEELPAKGLQKLAIAFAERVIQALDNAGLSHGQHHIYVTPRRLALRIEQLADIQPTQMIERKGPALTAAFDQDGNPSKAAEGFARSCGVAVTQLTKEEGWLVYRLQQPGKSLVELIPTIVQEALDSLPIPKAMRWGYHQTLFLRPIHWVLMLYGDQDIPVRILNILSRNITHGHRFLCSDALTISHPREYENTLKKEGKVIPDFSERRKKILQDATLLAQTKNGILQLEDGLLDEITGLVEWPVALLADFDERFLKVPHEALISAMQSHQKSIPMNDKKNHLLPHFIIISNIESKDPKQVIQGNERVMRARLSDAEFFYTTDCKHSLESRLDKLKQISFQAKLGSLHDKSQRVVNLIAILGQDKNLAQRAALLSKTDLTTEMVGEFPELQGVMGYHYALRDGEPKEVAIALREQYFPRFAGDQLPESSLGCALALADRLDTLVGIFGINQQPTGDKDPFALRRAAQGILRILIEKEWNLDLAEPLKKAIENYQEKIINPKVFEEVIQFLLERLRAWYHEQGIAPGIFVAVSKCVTTHPLDFHRRIQAVQEFLKLPQAENLIAANKRVSNLLEKTKVDNKLPDATVFQHATEKALWIAVEKKIAIIEALYHEKKYTEILISLADLQAPIDQFFTDVMVMVDDENLRTNRLRLLRTLQTLFLKVADVSLI